MNYQYWSYKINKAQKEIADYEKGIECLIANPKKTYNLKALNELEVTYYDLDRLQYALNTLKKEESVYKKRFLKDFILDRIMIGISVLGILVSILGVLIMTVKFFGG